MILSVGCGNQLIKGVTHYLDLYPDDSKERKAKPGKIIIPKEAKFIQGDVQDMNMFANKQFEYVYANNVLEHVEYPEIACDELQRVAKAGIIICPSIFGELFFGWEYHRWLIIEKLGTIWFFNKRNCEYIPFGRFFKERIGKNKKYDGYIIPEIKRVFDSNKNIFEIRFEWQKAFQYHVIRRR